MTWPTLTTAGLAKQFAQVEAAAASVQESRRSDRTSAVVEKQLWKHVQRIDKELEALKLDPSSTSTTRSRSRRSRNWCRS